MSKFKEAYYKLGDEYITVKVYSDNIHREKIYCPECHTAPIHIVRKEKIKPYFASDRNDKHLKDCQFYEEFISNKNLIKLIDSKNIEDKKRLNFLIDNGLQGAINILIKNRLEKLETEQNSIKENNSYGSPLVSSNTYKRESITRVNIKNLIKRKDELLDNFIIIWGKASIQSKEDEKINSKTKEKFKSKILNFRKDNEFKFLISLNANQINYYKELPRNMTEIGFAVFGLLKEIKLADNIKRLKLEIKSTQHIYYDLG